MALNIRGNELEYTFIKERVKSIEKYFDEISSRLQSYNHELARFRDSGDEVAKSVSSIAAKENCNQSLRLRLGEFADVLVSIQEYREAQIERIEVKVVHELENFKPLCKQTMAEIKKCFDARVIELKKKNDLEKARCKSPQNWQKISKAEKKVNQAQEEAKHMSEEMRRIVDRFEKKKLEGLQSILLEFVRIEMIFHAKAIEQNSMAFNILKNIKVDEDLHEFNSHFKAYTSSLDAEALLPASPVTKPKTVEDTIEHHSTFISDEPQAFRGIQGTARSVFTLKTAFAQTVGSDDSSENITPIQFETTNQ